MTSGDPIAHGAADDVSQQSIGELIGDVSRDLSTLMRQELELAKAEIKTEVAKTGKAAGMLGGAGFAGWAALIVAVVWGVIGAVMYATGRKKLRTVHPKPERTVETVGQIPGALNPR